MKKTVFTVATVALMGLFSPKCFGQSFGVSPVGGSKNVTINMISDLPFSCTEMTLEIVRIGNDATDVINGSSMVIARDACGNTHSLTVGNTSNLTSGSFISINVMRPNGTGFIAIGVKRN